MSVVLSLSLCSLVAAIENSHFPRLNDFQSWLLSSYSEWASLAAILNCIRVVTVHPKMDSTGAKYSEKVMA